MQIHVNGKETTIEKTVSISQLLQLRDVKMPDMVSVELNGTILDRDTFDNAFLNEDDKVEFLYFMGGGNNEFNRRTN